MKNFNIMEVHWKIQFLGRGGYEKQYMWGELPKKGAWTVCRFKRGLGKKRGVMFLKRGWYPNEH